MLSDREILLFQTPERVLLVRAKNGDRAAFDELVHLHRSSLEALCWRLLKDIGEAEDATQETFHRAYLYLPEFRENSSFRTWLWRIASHHCLNVLRSKRSAVPLENIETRALEIFNGYSSPMTAVDNTIGYDQMIASIYERARSRTPPWDEDDYFIFEAYYREEDRSLLDVARILGRELGFVKYRFYEHILPVLKEIGREYWEM